MENILIASQVGAIATIASIAELDDMVTGDVIAVGDGRKVFGIGTVAADLTAIKEIVFITKLATGQFKKSVSIPRDQIVIYNEQLYSAPQNKIVRIGGITEPLSLVIPNTGEGNITARNLSYNHTIAKQRVDISVQKIPTETAEAYVDRVVLAFNAAMAKQGTVFTAAAKVIDGTNTYIGITFTNVNEHVDLALSLDGIFAGVVPVIVQEAKMALGKGEDVLNMEKDFSRNQGNAGYENLTDLWYNQPNASAIGTNYNMVTLGWDGIAPRGATSRMHVANNTLSFAFPTASNFGTITGWFTVILGTRYALVGGTDPGDEPDQNLIDNTH